MSRLRRAGQEPCAPARVLRRLRLPRPHPGPTAVELRELDYAVDSSSVRINCAYARFIRTCLCDVNGPIRELRWTWSADFIPLAADLPVPCRSEEHTSELQSHSFISHAV